ncbi:MAG: right-handed parallel beta-helix repeat-containing protein [Saprospiraceae bacterium]|nr:right-handed parallel beta-helix repeat-containing protein [Saprospiraceae bacterium]
MIFIATKKRFYYSFASLILVFSLSIQQGFAQPVSSFPYFYDFENENTGPVGCNPSYTMVQTGWLNASGDDMDWTNDVNGTGSSNTGPNLDHTPNGTFYMYLETSCSAIRTANLETPTFDFSSAPAPQVSFWYHMYGASMGSLFFEVSTNGGSSWTTLWSRTGQQHNSSSDPWLQASVNTAAYGGQASVKFRFRGVSTTNFTGDMAIDDFLVENIIPDNAGISAMISPVLGSIAGSYPVDVTLENFGSNAIDTVNIEWEINGAAQPSVLYTGPSLAAYSNTSVNLSASNAFPSGLTNLKFWTSNPNNVADTDNGNDTLSTFFCTGLAGNYTVGTPTSDFPTFTDALSALFGCGVGGPVTMEVQPGTYGTLSIDQPIPNISSTNTVTWDGSSQAAVISVASDAAVKIDGVSHITIQDFTISNSSTTTGWGILLTNSANYNSILNNRIQMASTSSFNTGGIVASGSTTSVSTSGDNANYTLVEGNEITGADRGISFYGTSTVTQYNSGNVIRNNNISDADNYGIYAFYQDSIEISGNYIHEFPSTFHYGVYVYYIMNFDLIGNDIRSEDYGMYIGRANSQTVPTRRGIVANNMVQSSSDRGVYLYFPRSMDLFHNTVVSAASAVVISSFDNTLDIKNNIFVSTSSSNFAFESFSSGTLMGMDYNVFYKDPSNPNLIDFGGTYTDLADWQTNGTYGYDQNSLEGMPAFYSSTDLHVDGAFLNDKGVLTSSVTTDIDGEVRPAAGAVSVDIGADEFTPPYNDAGVLDLASPSLPITGGFSSVEISIKNYGIDDLSSFSVEWEINGLAQSPVPYTGVPVATGANTTMILANINFPVNTTSLSFWTTMPNGVPDERTSNDTLTIDICPGLAGTYTVGHTSSDFPTFSDAIDALMSCGVSAAVNMEVQPGTYSGPLVFNEIPGSSSLNTVTFDGMDPSSVTITHDGFNTASTVSLDGVDYLTLKNLTIENTGVSNAFGVLFTNAANHNTIENNNIMVPVSPTLTNVVGVLASANNSSSVGGSTEGDNANWNLVKGNDIMGGVSAVIFEGGVSNLENTGNQIVDNNIHDAYSYGIYADEQDSFVISGNTIYDITATTSDAMMLYDIHNFSILANDVTSKDYGIAIFGGFTTGDQVSNGLIANNMVACALSGEAFYMRDANVMYIYHNTFSGMPACYLDNHANIDLRNNILSTANSYCFYTLDPVSMSAMDNNLFHITSPVGIAVRFGTTNYATLADWQTNGPAGYDANSVTGSPNFINGLHIGGSLPVDTAEAGITIPILTDIDGDVRPLGAKPDIGADEHIVIASDVMVVDLVSPTGCGNTAQDIIVSIANVGSNLLIGVPLTVNVTGALTANFNTNLPLIVSGITTNVNMGTINTAAGGQYDFEIILSLGNDMNRSNDTLRVSLNIPPSNQVALSMSGDSIVCYGNTATIGANASYSPATVHWYDAASGGNFLYAGTAYTTNAITNTTTFYAEVQGCSSPRAMITVEVDTIGINLDLGPDMTICGNQTTEIIPNVTLSSQGSIIWSDGSQSSIFEVLNTGDYSATVTSTSGCIDSDTITISSSPAPSITSVQSDVTCGGYADGSVDLTITGGSGPYSYLWSNSATTEDLDSIPGGNYNVTVIDNGTASNCEYVQTFTIDEPLSITANIDVIGYPCNLNDGSMDITVSGGSGLLSYLWSNGETTQNVSNLSAGPHSVTITDTLGCTIDVSGNVPSVTPIVITVDTIYNEILALAGGINITATGGTGTLQYFWNTGATTDDITGLTAGSYSVTVTDLSTGCQQISSNIIVVYQIPDFVNDIQSLNAFELFPNPTTGQVWVNMTLSEMTSVQLDILNITGQVVQSFATQEAIEQNYSIDMGEYPSGVYLARFVIGTEVLTTKIILE